MTPWDMVQTEPYFDGAFRYSSHWLDIFDYIPLTREGSVGGILDLHSRVVLPTNNLIVKLSAHLLEAFSHCCELRKR